MIPLEDIKKAHNNISSYIYKTPQICSSALSTDNQKIYDMFLQAMAEMNERAKQNSVPESKIKLPKLKRVDGQNKI